MDLLALVGCLEDVLEPSNDAQRVGEDHVNRMADGVEWKSERQPSQLSDDIDGRARECFTIVNPTVGAL